MKSLRRVVNQIIHQSVQQLATIADHIHMARAYRPVSQKMMPRWRNMGKAITPYHFMTPVLIPIQNQPTRNNR